MPEKPMAGSAPRPSGRPADPDRVITAKQMEPRGPRDRTPNLIQALIQLGFVKEPDITSLLVKQLKILREPSGPRSAGHARCAAAG